MYSNKGYKCDVPVCEREAFCKGYCKEHYYQARRGNGYVRNRPIAPPTQKNPNPFCSVGECGRKHYAHGLCFKHYMVVRRRRMQGRV